MDLRLSGFSGEAYTDAKLMKQEAESRIASCNEAYSIAYRMMVEGEQELGAVDGPTAEEVAEYKEDVQYIIKSNEGDLSFWKWVIELCDNQIESQIGKLREIYEEQKDSGE